MQKYKLKAMAALALVQASSWAQTQETNAPPQTLEVVTVTASKEKTTLQQTPASIGVLSEDTIRMTAPTHPQQLLGQIPEIGRAHV